MKSNNDGNIKEISARSQLNRKTNDGKKGNVDHLQKQKTTVNYTFERTNTDIMKIKKLRSFLKQVYSNDSFNTDSEIYRKLPDLYLDAVKSCNDQDLVIDELQSKLAQLEDLKHSFCRIFEICELK